MFHNNCVIPIYIFQRCANNSLNASTSCTNNNFIQINRTDITRFDFLNTFTIYHPQGATSPSREPILRTIPINRMTYLSNKHTARTESLLHNFHIVYSEHTYFPFSYNIYILSVGICRRCSPSYVEQRGASHHQTVGHAKQRVKH